MEPRDPPPPPNINIYRECLRNHAASLGSYATDGCGEFTLDDTTTSPSTLQCAACGCHRNFHRKVITFNNSHYSGDEDPENTADQLMESADQAAERSGGKKRVRTKFTAEQKGKMLEFAEKLGWRMQRKEEEDEVGVFCRGIGVSRQVFKVWMHNHKNSFSSSSTTSTGNASSLTTDQ